jgi:tRNA (cytidine32/uridine32-2'-O)-methyltransferase
MMNHIRIVLVRPSHPGNIGAVARAMKTMGLHRLCLVAPKKFPAAEADARAAGAEDILQKAFIFENLLDAIHDCELVFGTSARHRYLERPTCIPRECAELVSKNPMKEVAILFGNEQSGLSNDELSFCQRQVIIPTIADFQSLNLAAAVQIIAYELFSRLDSSLPLKGEEDRELALVKQLDDFYKHFETVMIRVNFLEPSRPRQLMSKLKRFFNRAQLEQSELNIFRGFLAAIEKKINKEKV